MAVALKFKGSDNPHFRFTKDEIYVTDYDADLSEDTLIVLLDDEDEEHWFSIEPDADGHNYETWFEVVEQ